MFQICKKCLSERQTVDVLCFCQGLFRRKFCTKEGERCCDFEHSRSLTFFFWRVSTSSLSLPASCVMLLVSRSHTKIMISLSPPSTPPLTSLSHEDVMTHHSLILHLHSQGVWVWMCPCLISTLLSALLVFSWLHKRWKGIASLFSARKLSEIIMLDVGAGFCFYIFSFCFLAI